MKKALISCLLLLFSIQIFSQTTLVIAATGIDKVYDRQTWANVTLNHNAADSIDIAVHYTVANFDTWFVGIDKPILVEGIYLTGKDAGDFGYNTTAITSANITPRPIIGEYTAEDKFYDKNTEALISSRSILGILPNDNVFIIGGTAKFSDSNAGANKAVTQTGMMISGNDAYNYYLDHVDNTTATIFPLILYLMALQDTKIYDGTVSSDKIPVVEGILPGDSSVCFQVFEDPEIGTDKTIIPIAEILDGAEGNNYITSIVKNHEGVILPATSGLQENSTEKRIMVYPNPSNGEINIVLSNYQKEVTISVFDLPGDKIYEKRYAPSENLALEKIDLSNKPKGIYLLKISDKSDEKIQKIILK